VLSLLICQTTSVQCVLLIIRQNSKSANLCYWNECWHLMLFFCMTVCVCWPPAFVHTPDSFVLILKLPLTYLTLDLSSSRVKDTLGHTSTPAFSVDSKLLRYFPGHADAFQVLLYGVYPVLSWSSRLSFCTTYIPVYSLSWQSAAVHSQYVPESSKSSLFYDNIYLLQLRCAYNYRKFKK